MEALHVAGLYRSQNQFAHFRVLGQGSDVHGVVALALLENGWSVTGSDEVTWILGDLGMDNGQVARFDGFTEFDELLDLRSPESRLFRVEGARGSCNRGERASVGCDVESERQRQKATSSARSLCL